MCHNVLGVLRAAEYALDDHVGQEPETVLVLGACRDASEDHVPHEFLIQGLTREVC